MPGSNPILAQWLKEKEAFQKNLSILKQHMDAEAIHDLRVAVKKLRSYFKLYSGLFQASGAETVLIETKKLFSVLGKHRNIELTRQLVISLGSKKNDSPHSVLVYLQLLQDQVADQCKPAIEHYENKELDELTVQLGEAFDSSPLPDTAGKVQKIIEEAVKNLKHDLKHFDKKSHVARKRLKDIFYWVKIFEKPLVFTRPEVKEMKKILDHLGDIQDCGIMLSILKNMRKTVLSKGAAEYEQVKKIETKAKQNREHLLTKSRQMIEKITERE